MSFLNTVTVFGTPNDVTLVLVLQLLVFPGCCRLWKSGWRVFLARPL
jgi:hypothetical protein